ncbi:MAG: hypothetical protein RLY31_995 [Bacteroidota bacterium]
MTNLVFKMKRYVSLSSPSAAAWMIVCCFLSLRMQAQMEVTDATTPPYTPENLITNIFLGEGVEVLNVTYEGDPLAVGYFKNAGNATGIDRGIILTTGRAASSNANCSGQLGANCTGGQFASNDVNSAVVDPDLQTIASGGLNDVAKYTITFIPTADTLRFKYVFASEEYPEWACSSFNDVFGFFISGPGISGPFSNNGKNIALIPGTNIPVTINNIHPQNGGSCPPAFVEFYNDNNNSAVQPVYDGYLQVFTAEAVVIPCETYTIKLAVADVGDNAYDTGVFLEAKSFGTGSLQVETKTISLDGTVTEGCATGSITFRLPNPAESDFPIDFTLFGSAENGVDYELIPTELFIPQGDSVLEILVTAIEDFLPEGTETVGFDVQRDICNRDTFWLFIRDNQILPPGLPPDTALCTGDTIVLDATLPIPLPTPPTFINDTDYPVSHTAPTYSPIVVAGVQPVYLEEGVIRSVCVNIDHKWVDDLDLFLISPGGQFIELSSDNGSNCDHYDQVCFSPTASGAILDGQPWTPCGSGVGAPFSNGTYQPEGIWSDLWDGTFPTNGTWQLLVIDDQTGFSGTLLDWSITFEPLYQLYYRWEPETGLSCTDCPDPLASPDTTTTYFVTAWDTYGCSVYDTVTVLVDESLPAPVVTCGPITNQSITFEWEPVDQAQTYFINLGNGNWVLPNGGPLSHTVNGLLLNQSVTIEVVAEGACPGAVGTVTCQTPDCDAPVLTADAVTDVTCSGFSDGSFQLSASGGAGGYTFLLDTVSNSDGFFSGLPPGSYQVTVVDAWGCPNVLPVDVGVADALVLQGVQVAPVACAGLSDGAVTISVSGGTAPYQFDWTGNSTDSILTGLPAGSYFANVTDANGCTDTVRVFLSDPSPLLLVSAATGISCAGASDGTASVQVSGGTGPYDILWDIATGQVADTLVTGLPTGFFPVSVTDANGCQQSDTVTILSPDPVVVALSGQNPLCANSADGSASVSVSGGSGNISFEWNTGSSDPFVPQLPAGTYWVTATDQSGCSAVDSVILTAPDALNLFVESEVVSCNGGSDGSVLTLVEYGQAPYTYSWSDGTSGVYLEDVPAGVYCVTVTDANGCTESGCALVEEPSAMQLSLVVVPAGCNGGNEGAIDLTVTGGLGNYSYVWSNGETTQDLSGIGAGNYAVVITDAVGCEISASAMLSDLPPLVLSLTAEAVSCFGGNDGAVQPTVSGGSGTYDYVWTGPAGLSSDQPVLTDISAGWYVLTVEDTEGCMAIDSLEVTQPTAPLSVAVGQPDTICFQAATGMLSADATGGTAPYVFQWDNGVQGAGLSGLTAGSYQVTATDDAGCTAVATAEIPEQGPMTVMLTQVPASCAGFADGSMTLEQVSAGNLNLPISSLLSIEWSNGLEDVTTLNGLIGGIVYAVTVTDALGCSGSADLLLEDPAPLSLQVTAVVNLTCQGLDDGGATVQASGGTFPYQYAWGGTAAGQTGPTAANLAAGAATVTVTDANGCQADAILDISSPSALVATVEQTDVLCNGASDGSLSLSASGGFPPYSLLWSTGSSEPALSDLPAATYSFQLSDSRGCFLSDSVTIDEPDPMDATVDVQGVSCTDERDGRITADVTGGSPPYRFSLDGVDYSASPVIIALGSGVYDLFIRDSKGCEWVVTDIELTNPDPLVVDLGPDTIVAYGTNHQLIPFVSSFGTGIPLTYEWYSNNPQVPPSATNTSTANFLATSPTNVSLTVTDAFGCRASDQVNLFVLETRFVTVPTGFAPAAGGDVANDLLHVHGDSRMVDQIERFQVFDRWGERLYEAAEFAINDLSVGWDGSFRGKAMPAGVYAWVVEVSFVDGRKEVYKGNTTLVR